jgi:hypothetical protein
MYLIYIVRTDTDLCETGAEPTRRNETIDLADRESGIGNRNEVIINPSGDSIQERDYVCLLGVR